MAGDLSPFDRYLGHPDFEAFACAIAATPNDAAPRLILSDWLRAQGDDAAADLAAGPLFIQVLAFARFRKATGIPAREAIDGLTDMFRTFGERVRHAFIPVVEAMRRAGEALEEADRQAEEQRRTSTPAHRSVERPG
jgi:uncharacterized protein (TIGR02996 family)